MLLWFVFRDFRDTANKQQITHFGKVIVDGPYLQMWTNKESYLLFLISIANDRNFAFFELVLRGTDLFHSFVF